MSSRKTIVLSGDESDVVNTMWTKYKEATGKTSTQALKRLLQDATKSDEGPQLITVDKIVETTIEECVEQKFFLGTFKSVQELALIFHNHAHVCCGQPLLLPSSNRTYTSCEILITCQSCGIKFLWQSSPNIGSSPLSDHRVGVGLHLAGINPAKVKRFLLSLGMELWQPYVQSCSDTILSTVVEELTEESCTGALSLEERELALSFDARYQQRTDSNNTTVVFISPKTNKVCVVVNVSKSDDSVTQNHEEIGFRKGCAILDFKGYKLTFLGIDYSTRIINIARDILERPTIALDKWHGLKYLHNDSVAISTGTLATKNKKWFEDLCDKPGDIKKNTFVYLNEYEIPPAEWTNQKLREERTREFRASMLNMVMHFQNVHTNCNKEAECSSPKYLPSRDIITNKDAVKKLTETLKKSRVYEFAEGMLLGITTSDDESFNHVAGGFIEKRINFDSKVYNLRIGICVLYWNENSVNRGRKWIGHDYMQLVLKRYFKKLGLV